MRILLIGERARAHSGGFNRVVTETCTGLTRASHEIGLAYHNDEPEVDGIDLFRLSHGGTVEEVALDAMATIRSTSWRLAVAGDGWHRGELEAQARRLGIADRVQFLGEIPPAGLATWYARSQLMLFPVLRQEPFGLVGVESLAYGKPIVAFAGGAVDEWLWPGRTGLRVEGRSWKFRCHASAPVLPNRAGCDQKWRSVEMEGGKITVGMPEEVGASNSEGEHGCDWKGRSVEVV